MCDSIWVPPNSSEFQRVMVPWIWSAANSFIQSSIHSFIHSFSCPTKIHDIEHLPRARQCLVKGPTFDKLVREVDVYSRQLTHCTNGVTQVGSRSRGVVSRDTSVRIPVHPGAHSLALGRCVRATFTSLPSSAYFFWIMGPPLKESVTS